MGKEVFQALYKISVGGHGGQAGPGAWRRRGAAEDAAAGVRGVPAAERGGEGTRGRGGLARSSAPSPSGRAPSAEGGGRPGREVPRENAA